MITGAAYEYEPNSYHFELEKASKEDEWTANNRRLDTKVSSTLTKYILFYYFEIVADYKNGKRSHYPELIALAKSFMTHQPLDNCVKNTNSAPRLIDCIKQ
jgi:hypothetical protein